MVFILYHTIICHQHFISYYYISSTFSSLRVIFEFLCFLLFLSSHGAHCFIFFLQQLTQSRFGNYHDWITYNIESDSSVILPSLFPSLVCQKLLLQYLFFSSLSDELSTWVVQSQDLMLRSTVSFLIVTDSGTFLSFNHLSYCIFPCPLIFLAIYALHARYLFGYLFVTDILSTPTITESPSVECQDLLIST